MAKQKQAQQSKQAQAQRQEQKVDLAQVVDRAFALDREIKAKQEELKQSKETLKEQAKARGVKTLDGYESTIQFSDETSTYINPKTLYDFLLEAGFDKETFFGLVSVKAGEARKALGEVLLNEVAEESYKEYAKASLKKKKED
jgi:hypothetical protein